MVKLQDFDGICVVYFHHFECDLMRSAEGGERNTNLVFRAVLVSFSLCRFVSMCLFLSQAVAACFFLML